MKKRLLLILALLSPIAHAQVDLNSNRPAPQVKGIVQSVNGGLGVDSSSISLGCPKVTAGVWTINSGNCSGGGVPANTVLVTEGDSVTAGYLLSSPSTQSWPAKLKSLPFFAALPSGNLHNTAVNGSTCASMTARYTASVHPYAPNTTGSPAYLFFMIGRNDIGSESAATLEACIDAYTTTANADGFKTVNMTITPSSLLIVGPVTSQTATITSFSATSGTATFQATNTFSVGQYVYLNPFSFGVPYLNFIGTVQAPTTGSEFTLTTIGTTPMGSISVTGTGTAVAYSSWDSITSAADLVRQQVNTYLLRDTTATLPTIDTASLIANPNDLAAMFDGTHPTAATDSGIAIFVASKLNPSGGELVQQPIPSNYNPIIQGAQTQLRNCTTVPNNAIVGDWTANPYGCIYETPNPIETFIDSFNPNTSLFTPFVVRALNFQLAPSGVQNFIVDALGSHATIGISAPNGFFGGSGSSISPPSGQFVDIYTSGGFGVVRPYDFGSATDIPALLWGSTSCLAPGGSCVVTATPSAVTITQPLTLAITGSTQCLFVNTAGLVGGTPCGSGSVTGGGTPGYYGLWSGATALGNGHIDDGISTASTITMTEPLAIATSALPTQTKMTFTTSHPIVPAAGSAVFGPDATGNFLISENNAAASRACTVLNALCSIAPVSNAVTSATGGSGTGTITCTTAVCTNLRGSYTVAGGTFATGTLLTLVWPTTTTAYACSAIVTNNATGASIGGHSMATATGMTFSSLTAATGLTVAIDYSCQP